MEYGPRALGHRSLLYRPDDKTVNDWMNRGLHRTEFMPFAPVVTAEAAPRYFSRTAGKEDAARFMTVTLDATNEGRRALPGCVHVDGTARPQTVERGSEMHRILEAYEKLTGTAALINTSFNMHEEPIVETAEDALRAHAAGGFFHLALGDSFVAAPLRGRP
jgi:carbamoyltransferase